MIIGNMISGAGSDSEDLYMHNILIREGQNYVTCTIISKDETAFSFSALHNWLKNNGLNTPKKLLSTTGKIYIPNNENIITSVIGIRAAENYIYIDTAYYDNGYFAFSKNLSDTSDVHVTDTVIKI